MSKLTNAKRIVSNSNMVVEANKKELVGNRFLMPLDKIPISFTPKEDEKVETSDRKQTCLEKIGIKERKKLIEKNIYNGKTKDKEYSSTHKNALSDPTSEKGKGTKDGGHTYFQPNYGKPKENPNAIDYSNFITTSNETRSVGNKTDIEKRNEAYLTRRYNYDINEYSSKNNDALSDGNVLGKGTSTYLDTLNGGGGYDVIAREENLYRNEWLKDLQYTKTLVDAEYDIQTEFKVASDDDDLNRVEASNELTEADWIEVGKYERKLAKKVEKEQRKKDKKEKRKDKNVNKKADQGRIDENGNTTPPEKPVVQTVFHGNSVVLNEKYNPSENYVDWLNRY